MRGRCAEHKHDERPSAARRGYDRTWMRIQAQFITEHPFCQGSLHVGQNIPGVLIDHIQPLVDGGTHDMSNLQTLCQSCHSKKTHLQNKNKHTG
jgi:5-methylcytosine-specific restriction protein A